MSIKKRKLSIVVAIILIIPTISFARYYEKIQNIKANATIAEPIFKVENHREKINQTIDKESYIEEYTFSIKNYEIDSITNNKRISQVDLEYMIEIINEKENFPIEYKLYEVDNNLEILNNQNKTELIRIDSNIEYERTYKLVVLWSEKDKELDSNTSLKICVNASQVM